MINISFFDRACVVTAHACGLRRSGLDDLLYGPDHIVQSIDALHYANHDRQVRREMRLLTVGPDEKGAELAEQQRRIQQQLGAARHLVKQRRIAELTAAGALMPTRPTDDPRQVARAWLGRFLSEEKEALVRDIAMAAGVPPAAYIHIRSIRQKISKAIDIGWLTAPVSDPVKQVLALDDVGFRGRVLADAGKQNGRDDVLCHPLVLNRWREQLQAVIGDLKPGSCGRTLTGPHAVPAHSRHSAASLRQFHDRRRLFTALLQRREECTMLITQLNDALTLAERRAPSYLQLKRAADLAYDELVRRHPVLYRHIRAALQPYETRYGRLNLPGSRSNLRRHVFAELERLHGTPPHGRTLHTR
ncbi:hypothetical protein HHL19_18615 [Streptomyces sp. R302]|uniref:hypothetical protein n=1 Tax=unclassified Streptomyces TaxID=2593676 RepID=UPI00145CFF0E|nr:MULTISPECIES: hypothetical protein [unclassified Streptomyces]NML54805.1 hypothetical protein [Streptomyces sp. R301]NML80626.1 hypothetical protein [Streptomyces sp. R302]